MSHNYICAEAPGLLEPCHQSRAAGSTATALASPPDDIIVTDSVDLQLRNILVQPIAPVSHNSYNRRLKQTTLYLMRVITINNNNAHLK